MEAVADKTDGAVGSTRGQRIGQLLLIVVVALIVAAAVYYALTIVRSTTFSTDRGFRVLDESIEQFENLQDSMASLLKLVPEFPDCKELKERARNNCIRKNYQSRLDSPELRLEDRVDEKNFSACTQTRRDEFLLRLDDPRIGFTIYPCSMVGTDPGSRYVLRGSLARSFERFNSQQFFDETVFALSSGAVLAELTPPQSRAVPGTALQTPHTQSLMITNASHLLLRAAQAAARADKETAKDAVAKEEFPAHPVVFSETIAGQRYRVFVVAFKPAYPVFTTADEKANATAAAVREDRVYLIGMKRERLAAALAYALWPNGTFAITIGTLLAMLIWPLASLRLSAPQDPISRGEALAVLTALILIPALLTIAVVWAWSYRTLQSWADDGAEVYAQNIEKFLVEDLQISANLLDEYRRVVFPAKSPECSTASHGACRIDSKLPLRPNEAATSPDDFWMSVVPTPESEIESTCCGVYYLWTQGLDPELGSWSRLRTALGLDELGSKTGPRLSAFGAVPQLPNLNLGDRPYFEALKFGNGWQVPRGGPWTRPPEFGMVAQRLFSRADAARTLQVAVPRCPSRDEFCGVVTGDTRVHALTATIDPPLLRFAIVDRNSGTVLFHSDDNRSLAENFITETGNDQRLHAALRLNHPTHFSGRYVGDPHRFYFQPMSGLPWAVVVFYPTKTLGDLPLQAGVAALTASAGTTLVLLLIVAVLLFSESSPARRALAYLWPQWRWRHVYAWLGWALIAAAIVATLIAFAFLRTDYGYGALGIGILLAVAAGWRMHARRSRAPRPVLTVRSYESAYIRCIVGVLFFVSILPAAWLSLDYHDAQVHGLLREAMQRASVDVIRRHASIANDLRRWVPDPGSRKTLYPDPWKLTRTSVPGFEFSDGRWQLNVFRTMPWARIDGPALLGTWRQVAWRAAAQSSEQLRRIALLESSGIESIGACDNDRRHECFRTRAPDAEAIDIEAPLVLDAVGDRASSERVTNPLFAATLAVLFVSLLLAALVARRLFGVGVPFSGRYLPVISIDESIRGGALLYRARTDDPARQHRLAPRVLREMLMQLSRENSIDLSTMPLDQSLPLESGNVLLVQLDVALLDVARRQWILAQLERLLQRPDIGVYMTCEKPPAQWLYSAEMHPEAKAEQRPGLQEELRWDAVFARVSIISLRRGVQATDRRTTVAPALRDARLVLEELYERHPRDLTDKDRADYLTVHADMHYHRAWKLCTRDERLLLHQLATGRFANPANHLVTERLIRAGFVALDPWPRLTDAGFARFVRTAETRQDFTEWQRDASRSVWRSVKAPLLIALLLVVGWLVWTAGDYVQAFSAILVAAVALLGQFGQVVNLVRGSVVQKGA